MRHCRLEEMVKGWFVGQFQPTVISTDVCEVAVKHYEAGDCEGEHFHKIATEITVVVAGKIRMAGKDWQEGDIIELEPGFSTDFEALNKAVTVVVKIPGASNDKYKEEK